MVCSSDSSFPLGYSATFPWVLPSWLVDQVYQDLRVFPAGCIQSQISHLSPVSTLRVHGHTLGVCGICGPFLQGLPLLGAYRFHWATLSNPHLTFDALGSPCAATVGEFIKCQAIHEWHQEDVTPRPLSLSCSLLACETNSSWLLDLHLAVSWPRHACFPVLAAFWLRHA